MDDAKYLYKWADQWVLNEGGATKKASGTPVIIFGDYEWGGKKPWKKLIDDPTANDIADAQLTEIIEPHLDKILDEQRNLQEVLSEIQIKKKTEKPAA